MVMRSSSPAVEAPTWLATSSVIMNSSCPTIALVEGVNTGPGSPAGLAERGRRDGVKDIVGERDPP
jgi:hypothetical protein